MRRNVDQDRTNGGAAALSAAGLIAEHYPRLSPSHRRIADFILARPHEAALLTIDRLASAVNVSAATANRFAIRLGLGGYPELTKLLRNELRGALRPIEDFVDTVGLESPSRAAPWTASMEEDVRRIRGIRAEGADVAFARATALLAAARRVYLVGFGSSAFIVQYADYYLSSLRDGTEALASASGTEGLMRKLVGAEPQDVALQLAFARYSAQGIQVAEAFRMLDVPLIGITDDEHSPLAPLSTICFFVGRKPGFLLSGAGAGTLSLIEALLRGTARALGREDVEQRSARLTTFLGDTILSSDEE